MPYSFKTKPYNHQLREFEEHWNEAARALIWQMRTGKSKAMIDLACRLWEEMEIDGVLVVAPNNVHLNWGRRELPTHHWDTVPYRHFVWDSGKTGNINYALGFEQFLEEQHKLTWYMVNDEALANEKARGYLRKYVLSRRRMLVIVDEVHEFRWHTSKRFQALRTIVRNKRCVFRRILSANPLDNNPLHAFAEFEILAPAALGFEKFDDFEARYGIKEDIFVPGGFRKDGTKKPARKRPAVTSFQNLDELQAKVGEWSSLVLRSDVDDMPELLPGRVEFELAPAQKNLHNALVRSTIARLDGGEIIPPAEGGVLVIRLQQIASGFVVDEEGTVHDVVPRDQNPRMLALLSEVRLCAGKFIIWCRFREDVVRVHDFLGRKGIKTGHYYGGTSKRDRVRFEEDLRKPGGIQGIVGQFQAGGQGLDFSSAEDIFWYSHTTDLLKRRQADERATKIGGRRIGVTDIVAAGSNDDKMLQVLEERTQTADYLTGNGLRKYLELIH